MPGRRGRGARITQRFVGAAALVVALVIGLVLVIVAGGGDDEEPEDAAASPQATIATTATGAAPAPTATVPPPTSAPATSAPASVPPTTVAPTTVATTLPPLAGSPVRVGHWVAFVPFQDRDGNGDVVGFDIDLLEAIGERLGIAIEWVESPDLGELYRLAADGGFDVIAGALLISPIREQAIDFTTPYFMRQFGLIADPVSEPPSFASLSSDDVIAVLDNSVARDWAAENLASRGTEIRLFEGTGDALDALRNGTVDALLSAVLYPLATTGRLAPFVAVDSLPTGGAMAFGVDPGRDDLRAAIDGALQDLVADGTYQGIYSTWFDHPGGSITDR